MLQQISCQAGWNPNARVGVDYLPLSAPNVSRQGWMRLQEAPGWPTFGSSEAIARHIRVSYGWGAAPMMHSINNGSQAFLGGIHAALNVSSSMAARPGQVTCCDIAIRNRSGLRRRPTPHGLPF